VLVREDGFAPALDGRQNRGVYLLHCHRHRDVALAVGRRAVLGERRERSRERPHAQRLEVLELVADRVGLEAKDGTQPVGHLLVRRAPLRQDRQHLARDGCVVRRRCRRGVLRTEGLATASSAAAAEPGE
jgi:hypothetical protein